MPTFELADLERFRTIVGRRLGLQCDNGKTEMLADVLQQRLKARRCASALAYLASIESPLGDREELRALASQLTVTETYFFRGAEHFRALAEAAFPERIAAHGSDHRLRLLSAGCASGDEAYSLAILIRERFPELRSWQIEILGLDLNPAMLAKARAARYTKWALRDTPDALRDRYFGVDGAEYVLNQDVRTMAHFEEQNLAFDWPSQEPFDLVLCRNVIMYLVPDAALRVVQSLTQALAPEGFLFLGYAETLRGLSHNFHLQHNCDAFYYQKRGDFARPPASFPEAPRLNVPAPLIDLPDIAWVDTILCASERIDGLSRECVGRMEAAPKTRARPQLNLGVVFELVHRERFREALEVLGGLPPETGSDPDVQILRAGLLTNCGDLAAAETVCRQILSVDDLNASAHYLTALCREHAGDVQSAMEHDRMAIYLDAAFAMPHLHAGRLAKRSADLDTARRELERAGSLLSREDPSRILLFGGGFSREALLAFSRTELQACGGCS